MSFLDRLKSFNFPLKIKLNASAGMLYHALATSDEPFARSLHDKIKEQLEVLNLELTDELATLTIEINVKRK